MKLTKWYPKHIKPARVGFYQVDLHNIYWYSYWNGKVFSYASPTIEKVICDWLGYMHNKKFTHPSLKWRGLAKKP